MKYLKSIDFVVQSIILTCLSGYSLIFLFATGSLESIAYVGLIGQFFIGCWQMISSLLLLILKAEYYKLRSFHFVLALGCLLLLALTVGLQKQLDNTFGKSLLILTGVIIPWCLAIFYYSITWRWMFPKHQGKFLPHINF